MIGIVIATHANLGEALLNTARAVVPTATSVVTVAIGESDSAVSYEAKLREAIESVRGDGGVLVLTDMFGGTPSNVGMTLHDSTAVEVLTGANLPMVVKAMQLASRSVELGVAARQIRDAGQRAIAIASEVLGAVATAGGPSA